MNINQSYTSSKNSVSNKYDPDSKDSKLAKSYNTAPNIIGKFSFLDVANCVFLSKGAEWGLIKKMREKYIEKAKEMGYEEQENNLICKNLSSFPTDIQTVFNIRRYFKKEIKAIKPDSTTRNDRNEIDIDQQAEYFWNEIDIDQQAEYLQNEIVIDQQAEYLQNEIVIDQQAEYLWNISKLLGYTGTNFKESLKYIISTINKLEPNEEGVKLNKLIINSIFGSNQKDKEDNNPLHWAALFHDKTLIKVFLDAGTNPDAKNKDGQTPLMLLLLNRFLTRDIHIDAPPERVNFLFEEGRFCLRLLFNANIDPHIKDNKGKTALEIYKNCVRTEIEIMLKEYITNFDEKIKSIDSK